MVCAWPCSIAAMCCGSSAAISAASGTRRDNSIGIGRCYRCGLLGVRGFDLIALEPIALHAPLDFNALEHELQCRPVDLAAMHVAPVADEFAGLEPLCPNAPAAAVEVQNLYLRP